MKRASHFLLTSLLLAITLTGQSQAATVVRGVRNFARDGALVTPSLLQEDASTAWKQGNDYYNAGRYAEAVEAYK